MKAFALLILALTACCAAQSSKPNPAGKNTKLTPQYSRAAVTALLEMDDRKFHAFHIAAQTAKTPADKLSVDRMKAFLLTHMLNLEVVGTMFDDENNQEQMREQTKRRDQWVRNLRYNDPDIPAECGLKF
jgi:hypothetical protein